MSARSDWRTSEGERTPALSTILMKMFREEMELRAIGKCPFCKKPVDKQDMSRENLVEFDISGLCSDCQANYLIE
jgi:hypothetical protein